jgi:hypothetical protein
VRAKIPDIHQVIDRALASNSQPGPNVHDDAIESRKWISDMLNRSRGSRLGSSASLSGRRRGSSILRAVSGNNVAVVDPSTAARAQAAEVSVELCFNDRQDKAT